MHFCPQSSQPQRLTHQHCPLKSKGNTHIPGKGHCDTTLHFPLLPKRALEKCLTPLLPFLSAPLSCCKEEEQESNKDLFIPKAALCTASFMPAIFPLSWHSHPMTLLQGLKLYNSQLTPLWEIFWKIFSRKKTKQKTGKSRHWCWRGKEWEKKHLHSFESAGKVMKGYNQNKKLLSVNSVHDSETQTCSSLHVWMFKETQKSSFSSSLSSCHQHEAVMTAGKAMDSLELLQCARGERRPERIQFHEYSHLEPLFYPVRN